MSNDGGGGGTVGWRRGGARLTLFDHSTGISSSPIIISADLKL